MDWENAKKSELHGLKQIGIIYDRYMKGERVGVEESMALQCNILHLPTPSKGTGKHELAYADSHVGPRKVHKQGEANSRFCKPLTNNQGNMVFSLCTKHKHPHTCKSTRPQSHTHMQNQTSECFARRG